MVRSAMARFGHKPLFALPLALALAGCATNPLRIDYAADVAAQGRAAASASAAFLGKVEDARIAANLELIARDPNCLPNVAHIKLSPDLSRYGPAGGSSRGWLCADGPDPAATRPLSMAPLGQELEPTFQLIAALGAYAEAISRILAAEPGDPAQDFTQALALLGAAGDTLCGLAGGQAGADAACAAPGADDPRLAAAGSFIGFVAGLAAEQDVVDQLRALAASEEGAAELAHALDEHLYQWNLSRRSDLALQSLVASSIMTQALRADPPPPPEDRRALLAAYYQRERDAREAAGAYEAVGGLLQALAAADRDMRRVLMDDPDLTPAERAQVARDFRARVTRAFETVTALATAF